MKLDEYKKEQIFSKVYNDERVHTFIELLVKLKCELSIYITSYRGLRFLREDEFDKSRYEDLQHSIKESKEEIESLINQLNNFFNSGFFQEITKEQADSIADEYQELVKQIIITDDTIENKAYQKFTDLIKTYNEKVVPIFKILNENIEIYNRKANEEGWKYKLRTYDEAVDYYNQNLKVASKKYKPSITITEWRKIDFDV